MFIEKMKQLRHELGLKEPFEGRMVPLTEVEYSKSNQVNFEADKSKFIDEMRTNNYRFMTYVMKVEKLRVEELLAKSKIDVQNLTKTNEL